MLEVVAANGAQPGETPCKALGKFGVCSAQRSKLLAQQGLLRRIIKIQKGRLPHVFKKWAARSLWRGRNSVERVQAKGITPCAVQGKPPGSGDRGRV